MQTDPPTKEGLAQLVIQLIQYQENKLGKNASDPPFLRLPVSPFNDPLFCFLLKNIFYVPSHWSQVVAIMTAEHEVLGSIPGSDEEFLSSSHGVWIGDRLVETGSPPITWDFNVTGEMWVYYWSPNQPNSLRITDMIVLYIYPQLLSYIFLGWLLVKLPCYNHRHES